MDPRPFHFDYRKPRFSNPTFQSTNLYNSIYQINQKQNKNDQSIINRKIHSQSLNIVKSQRNPQNYQKQMGRYLDSYEQINNKNIRRNQSTEFNTKNKQNRVELTRFPSNNQLPIINNKKSISLQQNDGNLSKLSKYGMNLMQNNQRIDQKQVYDRQQKQFNIINYKPQQYISRLKMYPRLTLEDKLNEMGKTKTDSPIKFVNHNY